MRLKRILALTVACLFLFLTGCGQSVNETWNSEQILRYGSAGNDPSSTEYILYSENDSLEFWINENTTTIKVVQKKTGQEWYSAPKDSLDADSQSTMILSYITPAGVVETMNTMQQSVSSGQYSCEKTDKGAVVTYSVGDFQESMLIPYALSVERYNAIYESFEDDFSAMQFEQYYTYREIKEGVELADQEKLLELYPLLKEQPLYILNAQTSSQLELCLGLLTECGYDEEQYEMDSAFFKQELKTTVNPGFRIQIQYELDGDDLIVSVPGSEIQMRNEYPLFKIDLLRYFGSPEMMDEGYFVLPDGSGSLMNFYNGKGQMDAYSTSVYGMDNSVSVSENYHTGLAYASLPMFGIKRNNSAMMAVIEEGDAIADIGAYPGTESLLPYANASFRVRETKQASLATGTASDSFTLIQEKRYQGDIKIRYSFLSDEQADYNGMAHVLRDRLFGNRDLLSADSPILSLEFVGMTQTKKQFLGMEYQTPVTLSTFSQVSDIFNEITDNGLMSPFIIISGWSNGGYLHRYAGKLETEKLLGGTAGLKECIAQIQKKNGSVYLDIDPQYTYATGLGDGFSEKKDSVRLLTKQMGIYTPFNLSSGQRDPKVGRTTYIHTLSAIQSALDCTLRTVNELNPSGLSLRYFGRDINSDFNEENPVDRQMVLETMVQQAQSVAAQKNLMTSGANMPLLNLISICRNIPIESDEIRITDESIPFLQMVISGYVQYTASPRNFDGNNSSQLLRMASTACGMSYVLAAQENDSNLTDLYSMNYSYWKKDILSTALEYQKRLSGLGGQRILRYEKIDDQVYKTTFENGQSVIVNYNEHDVQLTDMIVPAQDYIVC